MTPSPRFHTSRLAGRFLPSGLLVLAGWLGPAPALALGPEIDPDPVVPAGFRLLPDTLQTASWQPAGGESIDAAQPRGPVGLQAAVSLLALLPQGEFSDYVGTGIGVDFAGFQYLGSARRWGIRFDLGVATYGIEHSGLDLGLIEMDITTEHDIFMLDMGPQVRLGNGGLQATLRAFGGASYFWTESSAEVNGNSEFNKTHASDVVPSVGLGGDLLIRVRRGPKPLYLDLTVQVRRQGTTAYARKGDVTLEGGRAVTHTVRSRTDMILVGLGLTFDD